MGFPMWRRRQKLVKMSTKFSLTSWEKFEREKWTPKAIVQAKRTEKKERKSNALSYKFPWWVICTDNSTVGTILNLTQFFAPLFSWRSAENHCLASSRKDYLLTEPWQKYVIISSWNWCLAWVKLIKRSMMQLMIYVRKQIMIKSTIAARQPINYTILLFISCFDFETQANNFM